MAEEPDSQEECYVEISKPSGKLQFIKKELHLNSQVYLLFWFDLICFFFFFFFFFLLLLLLLLS